MSVKSAKITMKKLLSEVKALMAKLPKLLPRRHETQEESEPAPGVLTPLDEELGRRIQARQARGRVVTTNQGGPNMPKWQFCTCGRRAKRTDKAQVAGKDGAFYKCPIHGEFFVRAPL